MWWVHPPLSSSSQIAVATKNAPLRARGGEVELIQGQTQYYHQLVLATNPPNGRWSMFLLGRLEIDKNPHNSLFQKIAAAAARRPARKNPHHASPGAPWFFAGAGPWVFLSP